MINFLKPAKYFVAISAIAVAASFISLFVPGPRLSFDFTGGTMIEITGENATVESVTKAIESSPTIEPTGTINVNATKEGTFLVRMRNLSNEDHIAIDANLTKNITKYQELQYSTIGSTVGKTMKNRSITALIIASIAIIVYIAFAFRGIPKKYNPWRFGVIAVVALVHDILITTGLFVYLSHTTTFEFDTLFITALLTVLGYSVNDTIVAFDRIRDNVANQSKTETFAALANRSLNESLTRSLNTSVTTLLMLLFLYLFGAVSVQWFVLALLFGIGIGTYSSIFIAVPLLVYWHDAKR